MPGSAFFAGFIPPVTADQHQGFLVGRAQLVGTELLPELHACPVAIERHLGGFHLDDDALLAGDAFRALGGPFLVVHAARRDKVAAVGGKVGVHVARAPGVGPRLDCIEHGSLLGRLGRGRGLGR
jgi:hypothetical protein